MYCPSCGTKIEGRQRYCPSCGAQIAGGANTDESQSRAGGLRTGAVQQVSSIGAFFRDNSFRIIIGIIMLTVSVMLIYTFINEFGAAFSSLSGLEKMASALSTLIYVLAVFIPVLLSLESIRRTFYISARLNPKEFNLKKYAVSKGTLLPITIDLLLCFAMVITPLILYNYKENDMLSSLTIIFGRYQSSAIICCLLCGAAMVLVAVSRKRKTRVR